MNTWRYTCTRGHGHYLTLFKVTQNKTGFQVSDTGPLVLCFLRVMQLIKLKYVHTCRSEKNWTLIKSRFFILFYSVKTLKQTLWAPSSKFVSSSIPSWQILTAHAQPFRGARDLAFCLKVPLDSLLVWASSEGSGETARMRRLAWTFAARIGDKYQIRLTWRGPYNCNDWFTSKDKYLAILWIIKEVNNIVLIGTY